MHHKLYFDLLMFTLIAGVATCAGLPGWFAYRRPDRFPWGTPRAGLKPGKRVG